MVLTLTINGRDHQVDADESMPLLWVLRDLLGQTGTKFGCGAGLCGACSVHVDGALQPSCQVPAASVAGRKITTIEGMRETALGQRLLDAWAEVDVVQCGYCQPGQIMAAAALIAGNPAPDDTAIDEGMRGNICRCGTYPRIRAAIKHAARAGAGA